MYPNPTYPHPLHRVCSWCKHWACRKGAESDASVLLKDRFPCSHKPGYLPGMLFVGRGRAAGQWGMQKRKKQTPRLLQGHLDDRREFYMDWRPSTASSGTCRLPLVFPSTRRCTYFTSLEWKALCAFCSQRVWNSRRESSGGHCCRGANGRISWKGAAKTGCVKPHPGCPLIRCYMEWKIWKHISG